MKKIVLCGGGSAGHVIPNIALLPLLKETYDEIHYIGSDGIEKEILSSYPEVIYHEISSVKLVRTFTLKNLKIPFVLHRAIKQSKKILSEIKPNVIFSKGGYVSVPVVLASNNISVIGHESDYTMGLANKIIYRKCKKMCFSFEEPCKKYKKKAVYSGSPIREEILHGNKEKLGLNFDKRPTLLFVGGSLGAGALNEFVDKYFDQIITKYNVIHIAGKKYQPKNHNKNYKCYSYLKNIEDCLNACDIVISRSGSNAIFEFLALNKPMILVPLPKSASRGDQILNAKEFEKKGYAKVIMQEDLNIDTLRSALTDITRHNRDYTQAMKHANKNIGNKIIVDVIKQYEK